MNNNKIYCYRSDSRNWLLFLILGKAVLRTFIFLAFKNLNMIKCRGTNFPS